MKLTNTHNIESAIARAVERDPYERGGDVSITGLCKPPQITALEYQHRDELTEDVSERLWALLGSAVHVVLDRAAPENSLTEEQLVTVVEGWKVSGRPDLWREPGEIVDYKVTSAWSFMLERESVKPEWEMQLNLYAALYRRHGFPVTKLTIAAILRDHMKSKALSDPDYPKIPFISANVNCWNPEDAERLLVARVKLYQRALGLGWLEGSYAVDEPQYPPCTDAERWAKPPTWAVMKSGRKSALRVLETKEDAEHWMRLNKGEYIDYRPGANTRCESYCSVVKWCDQAKALGVGSSDTEKVLVASIEEITNA